MHSLIHHTRAQILSPPTTPSTGPQMETNLNASREARRFLTDRVRTDWDYPNLPAPWSASDEEVRSVRSFRERSYGTPSESDEAEASVVHAAEAHSNTGTAEGTGSASGPGKVTITTQTITKSSAQAKDKRKEHNPYQFDTPDSIGIVVAAKADERARKRREALAEELSWNEGLKIFEERRDAWTGAASVRKYGPGKVAKVVQKEVHDAIKEGHGHPDDSDGSKVDSANALDITGDHDRSGNATVNNKRTQSSYFATAHTPDTSARLQEPEGETLVPVAPRLLASNPVRQSINPKIYPDVFNKVVVQNRTPSVPINLADMTAALVEGWKNNDEWPPKPAAVDPLPGTGRRKSVKDGSSSGPFLANHPHVRKGVESVKKVFRISGSQSASSNNAPQD